MTHQPTFFDVDPGIRPQGQPLTQSQPPSLSIDAVHAEAQGTAGVVAGERSRWQEVPQPLFDSWSPAMQLAYCARRDEDSARHACLPEESEWFLERAAGYRRAMKEAA